VKRAWVEHVATTDGLTSPKRADRGRSVHADIGHRRSDSDSTPSSRPLLQPLNASATKVAAAGRMASRRRLFKGPPPPL